MSSLRKVLEPPPFLIYLVGPVFHLLACWLEEVYVARPQRQTDILASSPVRSIQVLLSAGCGGEC